MDYAKQLETYLEFLDKDFTNQRYQCVHTKIDSHNADLIREFARNYRSLPTEPGDYKALTLCHHLKSISQMLNFKPLDALTEEDLKDINRVMRDWGQQKLVMKQNRALINDTQQLLQIKHAVEEQLKEVDKQKLKTIAVYK